MLLQKVCDFIQQQQKTTADDISTALSIEPQVVQQLIEFALRKRLIKEQEQQQCGSKCSACHCQIYVWIETSQSSVKL